MRLVLPLVLVLACGACTSTSRWEREGAQQARNDIAAGRPALRMDDEIVRQTSVDLRSGLPIENCWTRQCGTGVDSGWRDDLRDGYNDVIRGALDAGELDAYLVHDKLLSPDALKDRVAGRSAVRLVDVGDAFETPDGMYRIEKYPCPGGEGDVYVLATDVRTGVERRLAKAHAFDDVTVFDDGTTIAIQSGDRFISTYDMRSGRELQLTLAAE